MVDLYNAGLNGHWYTVCSLFLLSRWGRGKWVFEHTIKDDVFNEKDVQSTLAMLKGKLNVTAVFVCRMQEHSFSVYNVEATFIRYLNPHDLMHIQPDVSQNGKYHCINNC